MNVVWASALCSRLASRTIIIFIGLVLLLLPACSINTCTRGQNMTNPRLVNGVEQVEAGHRIRITWDQGTGRGASLPDAYFAVVRVESGVEFVNMIQKSGEREITIIFNDLATHLPMDDTA